jgi:hypothetical protein
MNWRTLLIQRDSFEHQVFVETLAEVARVTACGGDVSSNPILRLAPAVGLNMVDVAVALIETAGGDHNAGSWEDDITLAISQLFLAVIQRRRESANAVAAELSELDNAHILG